MAAISRPATFCTSAPATTDPYTLSLHDALPISGPGADHPIETEVRFLGQGLADVRLAERGLRPPERVVRGVAAEPRDRKRTRLNSSHSQSPYAVPCPKKKHHRAFHVRPWLPFQDPQRFVLVLLPRPIPTLFPYTTLFRSPAPARTIRSRPRFASSARASRTFASRSAACARSSASYVAWRLSREIGSAHV